MGQQFGVAKGARIIIVKCTPLLGDGIAAIGMIVKDLFGDPKDRKNWPGKSPSQVKKSVVVMAQSIPLQMYAPQDHDRFVKMFEEALQPLVAGGIPVVLAAGNERLKREDVSDLPQVLHDTVKFPLIVVGGTDRKGNRYGTSQGGSKVLLHAPGDQVGVLNKDGTPREKSGTSFGKDVSIYTPVSHRPVVSWNVCLTIHIAAPAVAGLIATYMAYDKTPWDDSYTGPNRIRQIGKYLRSDASSVVRSTTQKDIRVAWNGAPAREPDKCGITIYLDKITTTETEWSGSISDAKGNRIDGCRQSRIIKANGKNYNYPCPALKDKLVVNFSSRDVVTFLFKNKSWTSDNKEFCDDDGWQEGDYKGEQVSVFCLFEMVLLDANCCCSLDGFSATSTVDGSNARYEILRRACRGYNSCVSIRLRAAGATHDALTDKRQAVVVLSVNFQLSASEQWKTANVYHALFKRLR